MDLQKDYIYEFGLPGPDEAKRQEFVTKVIATGGEIFFVVAETDYFVQYFVLFRKGIKQATIAEEIPYYYFKYTINILY